MKKLFALVWALFMCLSLAACGNTESDDTQSGYETVMDMEFLDGMWSIDGTAKLYFNSKEGFYLGETIVINSSLMQYIACSPDYSMSGTINDEGEGMGLYLYDDGTRAYLCPSDDGNSFTLSADRFGRYGDDQHFDGVFYRDADFYTYTDMENAEFYEDEYSAFYIWYYDGVNRYLLGNDYTIGDDGLAYHDNDGLIYPAGWIPEEPYDPAVDWGENWMDNWDI